MKEGIEVNEFAADRIKVTTEKQLAERARRSKDARPDLGVTRAKDLGS